MYIQYIIGQGLVDKLNDLNACCKVTVLRLTLERCGFGSTGGVSGLAEALASFLSASLVELDLESSVNLRIRPRSRACQVGHVRVK